MINTCLDTLAYQNEMRGSKEVLRPFIPSRPVFLFQKSRNPWYFFLVLGTFWVVSFIPQYMRTGIRCPSRSRIDAGDRVPWDTVPG
jgi:hypothetical protein